MRNLEIRAAQAHELAAILEEQGKTEWARQEFEAILAAGPPAPKVDPWRKTSGMHGLRSRRQLGMLRALWQARDELARRRDIAPGRVLPDAAIVSAVQADPKTEGALLELPVFRGRANRKLVSTWFGALVRGRDLPEGELPLHSKPGDGPPPVFASVENGWCTIRLGPIDFNVQIRLADHAKEPKVLYPANLLHHAYNLVALSFEFPEVRSEDFDREFALHAANGLFHVVRNRLGEVP